MKFSPVYVGDFESRMLCSIPNLRPNQKGPEVAVKGRSLMSLCHFELEDSDYITAKRRVPELQGPKGATLDLNTRVIEFEAIGVRGRHSRTFMVMNPSSSTYSFQWTCQDPEAPPEQVAAFCHTERGRIQPGKQAERESPPCADHLSESRCSFLVNCSHDLCSDVIKRGLDPVVPCSTWTGQFPITVFFTPTLEGEAVFSLKCDVKRKTQPLSLNIKATGYSVHTSVRCEDSDGCVTELSAQEINVIDFKEVQLNKNVQHLFSIHNNSKFSFTFSWELSGPAACKQVLTVTPQTVLQAKGKAETQLAFHPQRMCSLKDVELTLQCSQLPPILFLGVCSCSSHLFSGLMLSFSSPDQQGFTCVFLATVVVPTVHFSTTRLNFGTCFIYYAGMAPSHQSLIITNQPDKDVSLSCLFTSTSHLHVDFPGYVLRPGGTVAVPITFYPREIASYHELIPFEINGLCQQTIEVRGRGTEMKVLCLKPTNELSLKPKGETCKVEVIFSPKCCIQPFTEEVMLECSGLVRSLFMVWGSCQGTHVSLDQEHLSFGVVVQQSYTSWHLTMQNTGDIGVKFKWDIKSFKPDFCISPTKGYIFPGMDVPFVVTFCPSKLSCAIQCEGLQCFIEGSEPLQLTLAGCCMETPVSKETLTFTCAMREKHSQTILLSNPNNKDLHCARRH
ncbi:hydrocephalus-inducing protein homolog [Strix aluco]|uniref:hydrocephalus-inducing protein homolog n=1 Tax=Strix aluco TaxID=111821 RepID=UPI003DA5081E